MQMMVGEEGWGVGMLRYVPLLCVPAKGRENASGADQLKAVNGIPIMRLISGK